MLRTYTFPVYAECSACAGPIENILRSTNLNFDDKPSDPAIKVSVLDKFVTARVILQENESAQETQNKLVEVLQDGAYWRDEEPINEEPLNNELTAAPDNPSSSFPKRIPLWLRWVLGAVGVVSGLAMMALMLSGIALPFWAMAALGIASTAMSLTLGGSTIFRALKKGALDMDSLYAISGIAAIAVTLAHLFIPGFHLLCDAGLLLFGVKYLGDALKESLTAIVTDKVTFKSRLKPTIKVESVARHVELDKVPVGSIICVPRGTVIPIDGIILDDEASIYENLTNGDIIPNIYKKSNSIKSGLRVAGNNLQEFIRIQTTHTFQDSFINQKENELIQSKNRAPKMVTLADKLLPYFVPAVIALAIVLGLAAMTVSFIFPAAIPPLVVAVSCIGTLLAAACPCSIGLVVPLATKAGVAKLAEHNVSFNQPEALQAAAQINMVCLDVNGTITKGEPEVVSFVNASSDPDLLSYISALEKHSDHAFARAIRDYAAKSVGLKTVSMTESNIQRRHAGISAIIDGKHVVIGNEKMMQQEKIDISTYSIKKNDAQHVIYVASDSKIIGHFLIEDPLRADAKSFIKKLHEMGMLVTLISGASDNVVEHYHEILGTDYAIANCPNKPDEITRLQQLGYSVAMIGDGGNDAIAMKISNMSIAFKSPTSDETTLSIANAIIESSSLLPIIAIFETAQQMTTNIKQNLMTSLAVNTLTMGIAGTIGIAIAAGTLLSLSFVLNPGFAAAAMVMLFGVVAANVYRFKQQSLTHYEQAKAQSVKEDNALYTLAALKQRMGSPSPQPSPATTISVSNQQSRAGEGESRQSSPAETIAASAEETIVASTEPSRATVILFYISIK